MQSRACLAARVCVVLSCLSVAELRGADLVLRLGDVQSALPVEPAYPERDARLRFAVRYTQPGGLYDTVGDGAAPAGAHLLFIDSQGKVNFWLYEPSQQSPQRATNGWHLLVSRATVPADSDHTVEVEVRDDGVTLRIDGRADASMALKAHLARLRMYFGDCPGQGHSLVGTVRMLYAGPIEDARPVLPLPGGAPHGLPTVSAPPGAAQPTIKSLDALPGSPGPGWTLLQGAEVTLGDKCWFEEPLTLTFGYPPDAVPAGQSPDESLSVGYWDSAVREWVNVPTRIDPVAHTVSVRTRHLSPWGLFRRATGFLTLSFDQTEHFDVSYSARELQGNAQTNDASWLAALAAEGARDPLGGARLPRRPGVPAFVEYAKAALEYAHAQYRGLGFRLPEAFRIDVAIGGTGDSYRSVCTGTLALTLRGYLTASGAPPTPESVRLMAAHELFHTVEAEYWSLISIRLRRWWVECAAEYAADTVWRGKTRIAPLPADFFGRGLNTVDDNHEYAAAHWLRYLTGRGISFKSLFDHVYSSTSRCLTMETANVLSIGSLQLASQMLGTYNPDDDYGRTVTLSMIENHLLRSKTPWEQMLRGFATYAFFDPTSPLATQNPRTKVWEPVADGLALRTQAGSFSNNRLPLARTQTSQVFALPADGTVLLWGCAVEPNGAAPRTVHVSLRGALPPMSAVDVFLLKGNRRAAGTKALGSFAAETTTKDVEANVAAGDMLYIMASNARSRPATVEVIVRAGPALALAPPKATGVPNQEVAFTAVTVGGPPRASYAWQFGDGTATVRTKEPNARHRFARTGTYTVRVIGWNDDAKAEFGQAEGVAVIASGAVPATVAPGKWQQTADKTESQAAPDNNPDMPCRNKITGDAGGATFDQTQTFAGRTMLSMGSVTWGALPTTVEPGATIEVPVTIRVDKVTASGYNKSCSVMTQVWVESTAGGVEIDGRRWLVQSRGTGDLGVTVRKEQGDEQASGNIRLTLPAGPKPGSRVFIQLEVASFAGQALRRVFYAVP
ncbi:MAG: PKD domain-containing protein [Armatimonadetes bacterium]|nr:PKD domain-containing protein [Armatimonadota bacterium]